MFSNDSFDGSEEESGKTSDVYPRVLSELERERAVEYPDMFLGSEKERYVAQNKEEMTPTEVAKQEALARLDESLTVMDYRVDARKHPEKYMQMNDHWSFTFKPLGRAAERAVRIQDLLPDTSDALMSDRYPESVFRKAEDGAWYDSFGQRLEIYDGNRISLTPETAPVDELDENMLEAYYRANAKENREKYISEGSTAFVYRPPEGTPEGVLHVRDFVDGEDPGNRYLVSDRYPDQVFEFDEGGGMAWDGEWFSGDGARLGLQVGDFISFVPKTAPPDGADKSLVKAYYRRDAEENRRKYIYEGNNVLIYRPPEGTPEGVLEVRDFVTIPDDLMSDRYPGEVFVHSDTGANGRGWYTEDGRWLDMQVGDMIGYARDAYKKEEPLLAKAEDQEESPEA